VVFAKVGEWGSRSSSHVVSPIRRYQSRRVEIPNIQILLYSTLKTPQPFHSKSFSIIAVPNSWERSSREDDSCPSDQEIPRLLRNPNNWAHLWTLCWRRMSVWIVSCALSAVCQQVQQPLCGDEIMLNVLNLFIWIRNRHGQDMGCKTEECWFDVL